MVCRERKWQRRTGSMVDTKNKRDHRKRHNKNDINIKTRIFCLVCLYVCVCVCVCVYGEANREREGKTKRKEPEKKRTKQLDVKETSNIVGYRATPLAGLDVVFLLLMTAKVRIRCSPLDSEPALTEIIITHTHAHTHIHTQTHTDTPEKKGEKKQKMATLCRCCCFVLLFLARRVSQS